MKLRVEGSTAFDDPCMCRCCGHKFTTQNAFMSMSTNTFERLRESPSSRHLLDQMNIACPKCRSADVVSSVIGEDINTL